LPIVLEGEMMDIKGLSKDLKDIILDISAILGKPIFEDKFEIIDRGVPHRPVPLPNGKMGIYMFVYEDSFLKIGKAGPKSNARFYSQHYNQKSAKSTLAASILSDKTFDNVNITESNIGDWIKENCYRMDILIDANLGIFALELIEAALHYKYEPMYEGITSQR
jgi:hypothetical protein